jgi:hypothetical protein
VVPEAFAALTSLVSIAFALSTFERWLDRRRPHELAWSIALAEFAAASLAQWWGASAGWGGPSFRAFYLFGPILSVPELALGTVLLLGSARTGRITTKAVHAWSLIGAGILLAAPLTGPIHPDVLPQGHDVFGPFPRVLAAVGSGLGATVLIAGALWSVARLARKRGTGRLVVANSLIATGSVVLSAGGLLNSVADEMTSSAVMHSIGISLIFGGFLVTNRTRRPRLAAVPATPSAATA